MTTFPALKDMPHTEAAKDCWCGAAEVLVPDGRIAVYHNDALGIVFRLHPINLDTFAQLGGRGSA